MMEDFISKIIEILFDCHPYIILAIVIILVLIYIGKMIKLICTIVWEISELLNLSLGRFAPYVFGGKIGRFPKKIKEEKREVKLR